MMTILATLAARWAMAGASLKGWGWMTWTGAALAALCLAAAAGALVLGRHDGMIRREASAGAAAHCDAGIQRANAAALAAALKRAAVAEQSAADERTRAAALDVIAQSASQELGEHMTRLGTGRTVCWPAEISARLNK